MRHRELINTVDSWLRWYIELEELSDQLFNLVTETSRALSEDEKRQLVNRYIRHHLKRPDLWKERMRQEHRV